MKKSVTQLWITALTGILCLGVVFAYTAQKNLDHQALAAGGGAPTLKLTWDFSANTATNTTAFVPSTLKTFLEAYDAPSFTYTVSSTNNTYKGSGNTTDSIADNNWKFSSSKVDGAADISGLPSYTLVKIWAFTWPGTQTPPVPDVSELAINGGTAQTIGSDTSTIYTFDGFDAQTSFVIAATKRFMINKIEFWGC
ncbi:MAG: hypothetical protein PHT30_03200 [Bacilli bacterium]|nr:hypothetical protein [Bacilli bacterium]